MCGIYLAKTVKEFSAIAENNKWRGHDTNSITIIYNDDVIDTKRFIGEFKEEYFNKFESVDNIKYVVGHTQSATTKDSTAHPIGDQSGNFLLWHNGVLKSSCIKQLQTVLNMSTSFDTELLVNSIARCGINSLNKIDGGFACILHDKRENMIYAFRNTQCPLFYNEVTHALSSVKSKEFSQFKHDEIVDIKTFNVIQTFKTKNNPFFII